MKLRDWLTLGAALVLIAAAFILGMRCRAGRSHDSNVQVVRDTLKIREVLTDTVIRWYERIVWREVKPETVVVYKDTINPDTIWGRWPEAIVSMDYAKGRLSFTSIAPTTVDDGAEKTEGAGEGSTALVKEYDYKVGERFELRSKGEGFHVRTLRPGLTFQLGVGSEVRLLGDTLSSRVVPFAQASLSWRGVSLGPRLDTRGLYLILGYTWRF